MNGQLTILVVEDDLDAQKLLGHAFRQSGIVHDVQLVTTGERALDYLRGIGKYADRSCFPIPGMIFVDLNLPGMSGLDVLVWIKEHPECSVIPVIIISGSEQDEDISKAYQLGANAYLVKPLEIHQLEKMVRLTFEFWAICAKPPIPAQC